MSLIALGTVALDNIKTASGMKRKLMGGSAAHFAMSARLFTEVHLVSVIGEDFPSGHIQLLRRKGINVDSV
ncbi:MAG TPA: sugar kinase, partial [Candidatus Omnitrophota bacterium]|nr:sugar kinase [Candidatus Omnitrophota bacterium]